MRVKLLIAVVVAVVVSFVAVGAATALPLTQSQPFQAVCGAQGGSFFAASSSLIFCEKHGSFAAFTPTQLAVQQTLCERVYGASFNVLPISNPPGPSDTVTICSTA
jgi:hypothetical protein